MEKEILSDNVTLWTECFGEITNPAIVLLAGAGAPASFWSESFCRDLEKAGYFVIRYDYRDTGRSTTRDFSKNPYSINDLTEDVVALLNGYEIGQAHLVGHSMGGFIAQFMAAYHPERVLSITCIAAGAAGLPKAPPETMAKAERDQMTKTWEVMMSNAPTPDCEESLPGFMKVWAYLMGDIELDEEMAATYVRDLYHRSYRPVGPHNEHMAVMQGVGQTVTERPEFMDAIETKGLVIHGGKDYLVTAERGGKTLAAELKHSKLVIIPKMGHMLFNRALEREIVELILDFISSGN